MRPCIFCAIVAGTEPAKIVHTTPFSIVIEPLFPCTDGHVLVIPRDHVEDFIEEPMITAQLSYDVSHFAASLSTDVNLIMSAGPAATQTVWHLHAHIVPRRVGDGLLLPWSERP